MEEKLKQCLKMMKYLGPSSYKLKGNYRQEDLPKKCEWRWDQCVILLPNGKITYYAHNRGSYGIKSDEITVKNLTPGAKIIHLAWKDLKDACRTKANKIVKQRLTDHQLKFDNLDFLIDK